MKESELRVGNLFRFISTNSIESVSDIKTHGLKTPVINNVSIKDTEPIPLTEEWLVMFGFEYEGGMGFKSPHNTSHWHFSIRNGFIPSIWVSGTILSDGYKGCKYVHQLQNLYFALTQKELIIK